MRLKTLTAALLTSMAVNQVAVGDVGSIYGKERHKDWSSFIVTIPNGDLYRAVTVDGNTILAIDIHSACAEYDVTLIEAMDSEPTHDESVGIGLVTSRIDTNDPHYGDGKVTAYKNEPLIYIAFHLRNKDRFLKEVMSGNVVRFKLGDDLYKRFSLSGSKAAIFRAVGLCRKQLKSNDSEYFM